MLVGWNESVKHTIVSATTTFQKVDPLGATRLLIAPITVDLFVFLSPTDEATTPAGIVCIRSSTAVAHNLPYSIELKIDGNAPLFMQGSGAVEVSVLHFYD